MFLYNITLKVDHSIHDDWLQWIQQVYLPETMSTGIFEEFKFSRLLSVDETDGITYAIQLLVSSMEAYRIYQDRYDRSLRDRLYDRYPQKFVEFRTLLHVITEGYE